MSSAVHARAQAGGLPPLLELMASRNGNLQHNAAFALYGLADNEDNIAAIVRQGGVQCLQDCELLVQVWGHQCCLGLLLYGLRCEVTAGSLDAQQERPDRQHWCQAALTGLLLHSPISAIVCLLAMLGKECHAALKPGLGVFRLKGTHDLLTCVCMGFCSTLVYAACSRPRTACRRR